MIKSMYKESYLGSETERNKCVANLERQASYVS